MVKNLAANAGDTSDMGSIPESGRSPGEGHVNLLQYSCLENSMDMGASHCIAEENLKEKGERDNKSEVTKDTRKIRSASCMTRTYCCY